jgi:shikimate kinase
MKIYLIGMPGSGKTTIGEQLSRKLSMDFVDLDKEIQNREGRSVQEIFSGQGEDYFRQVESQLLREWSASPASFIMSTGGGTPCHYEGIDVINSTGLSIFLDDTLDVLLKRLSNNKDRPLLTSENANEMKQKLEALRTSRLECYNKASITVHAPNVTKVADALRANLKM